MVITRASSVVLETTDGKYNRYKLCCSWILTYTSQGDNEEEAGLQETKHYTNDGNMGFLRKFKLKEKTWNLSILCGYANSTQ